METDKKQRGERPSVVPGSARRDIMQMLLVFALTCVGIGVFVAVRFPGSGFTVADFAIVIAVAVAIMILPALFLLGAWHLQVNARFLSPDTLRGRWQRLLVYSFGALVLLIVIGILTPNVGTFTGWLVSFGTILTYGFVLTVCVATMLFLVSLARLLIICLRPDSK